MGLDQYAYRVKKQNVIDNLNFYEGDRLEFGPDTLGNDLDFDYWRKFYPLDRWAEEVYDRKGGKDVFNCSNVRLDLKDLDELEKLAQEDEFYDDDYFTSPQEGREWHYEHLMRFIKNAREAINSGDAVYYSNWW